MKLNKKGMHILHQNDSDLALACVFALTAA